MLFIGKSPVDHPDVTAAFVAIGLAVIDGYLGILYEKLADLRGITRSWIR